MDKSLRWFVCVVLLLVAGIAVPTAAVAGDVPDVQLHIMTPGEINALASQPAPSLSYLVVNVDTLTRKCYMGDYNQISNNGTNFLLAWGDNSNGDPNVMFNKK